MELPSPCDLALLGHLLVLKSSLNLLYRLYLIASEQANGSQPCASVWGSREHLHFFPCHMEFCIIMSCFHFYSILMLQWQASVQLCLQISSQNDYHSPRCPLGFPNQRKESMKSCPTNCLFSFLSLSSFSLPHRVEAAGFTLLCVCQVFCLFHIPDFDLFLGPQCELSMERKATFLIIFLMKHYRNISPIPLQMPAH